MKTAATTLIISCVIEAGQYPGIVKTTLDGFNQRAYLEGTNASSARDHFFYILRGDPIGGRQAAIHASD